MRPTNELKEWEWIDAYHRGTLSLDERLTYEQELARDAAFRQTSDQFRAADHALKLLSLEHTVRMTVHRELAQRPQRRWRLKQLAGALLVIGLLYVGYLSFSRVDMSAYQNDISLTLRYHGSNTDTALTPPQQAFYRNFFEAQAFLTNGQPELAIKNLEKLAHNDSLRPYFRQAVQWHLLNAYLLSKQPDNAETTLRLLDQANTALYPIDRTDRWKVWWQIRWQKLAD